MATTKKAKTSTGKGKDITKQKNPNLKKTLPPSFYSAPKRKKGEKPGKDEPTD
jgi:hypothetical protein